MSSFPALYRVAARMVHRTPLGSGKVGQSVAGRKGAAARWARWAASRGQREPTVWVHAASVGEAQTAAPVMQRLRVARPGLEWVLSCSSPSLAAWPDAFGAVHRDYAPLDEPREVRQALETVKPSLVIFARGDLWPELLQGAASGGRPVAVIGATVRPGSQRLRWPLRGLATYVSSQITWVGAVSDADANRWARLGVAPDRLSVTGDPRHDAILERVCNTDALCPLFGWRDRRTVLVAGSVESADDTPLLHAAARVLGAHPASAMLLVPHETSTHRIDQLEMRLSHMGLAPAIWRPGEATPAERCVIVEARGLLGDLYAVGDLAYVGGGYRRGRLHAVMEPAAYGVPVLFGNAAAQPTDGERLVAAGGAQACGPSELADVWGYFVGDADSRKRAGLAARASLHEGGAARTARSLLAL